MTDTSLQSSQHESSLQNPIRSVPFRSDPTRPEPRRADQIRDIIDQFHLNTRPTVAAYIGAGAIELAGARAPKFLTAGVRGAQPNFWCTRWPKMLTLFKIAKITPFCHRNRHVFHKLVQKQYLGEADTYIGFMTNLIWTTNATFCHK